MGYRLLNIGGSIFGTGLYKGPSTLNLQNRAPTTLQYSNNINLNP